MSQTIELLNNSELAFASYANFESGMPDNQALIEIKMSNLEIETFIKKWSVVAQYSGTSGAAATVFEDIETGKRYLAIRGTESVGDYIADGILSAGFPSYLSPQFFELRDAVQAWIDNGTLTAGYTVTGHSLGGYLAVALGTWFRGETAEIYTYNAPGVGGLAGNVVDAFRTVFGFDDTALVDGITNIRGSAGMSMITGLGAQLVEPTFVETESSLNPIENHGIVNLTDSLALYAAFAQLDSSLTLSQIGTVFKATSNDTNTVQEAVLDTLRTVLLGVDVVSAAPTIVGSRDSFFDHLYSLQSASGFTSLLEKIRITTVPSSDLDASADFAAFLGLMYLTPFMIQGDDEVVAALKQAHTELAAQWEADRILSADERAQGKANFSDEWLADRAIYLNALYEANLSDTDDATSFDGDTWTITNANTSAGDLPRILTLKPLGASDSDIAGGGSTGGSNNSTKLNWLYFGADDTDNVINGGAGDDRLYAGRGSGAANTINGAAGDDYIEGADGTDTLNGGVGNDTLKGGAGSDTYQFQSGDGIDTITDSDGQGKIICNDAALSGGKETRAGSGVWLSEDQQFQYLCVTEADGSKTLIITRLGASSTDRITVRNFSDDALGIVLENGETNQIDPGHTGTGDGSSTRIVRPSETNSGRNWDPDFGDDFIPDAVSDTINGTAANDLLLGMEGRDFLDGTYTDTPDVYGDDTIEGGGGADLIRTGSGDDMLYAEDAVATAEAIEDGEHGEGTGLQGDWISAGAGDDTLIGSAANDVLMGGSGEDLLVGGAGDDTLDGDNNLEMTGFMWTMGLGTSKWTYFPYDGAFEWTDYEGVGGTDIIYGGAGNDKIMGRAGHDYLFGGEGNDIVSGGDADDTIFGGAGDDLLAGEYGSRTVLFDQYVAILVGNDYIDGGAGNDWITGEWGHDVLYGGDGDDTVYGDAAEAIENEHLTSKDYIDGGEGDDTLYGVEGDDELYGGEGNDHLYGDASYVDVEYQGDDYLDGGAGEDELVGHGGQDELYGGSGNDTLFGEDGDDILDGEEDNDYADGGKGSDVLYGGSGNDTLYGAEQDDRLSGESGEDELIGGDGDDILAGGSGDDVMAGGAGNDSYAIAIGDGQDTLIDAEGINTVSFGAGISPASLKAGTLDGTLLLQYGSGDSLRIDGAIDQFRFDDGSVMTAAAMLAALGDALSIPGTDTSNNLQGGGANDEIWGFGGDDALSGGGGDDRLQGGDGQDVVAGDAGDDLLFGEAGDDILHGGTGNDLITGGDGDDTLYGETGADRLWGQSGNDTLYGGDGDDELMPGDGADVVSGGRGNDTIWSSAGTKSYLFESGDGNDVVYPVTGTCHIVFGPGIARSDIRMYLSPAGAASYVLVQYGDADSVLIRSGSTSLDYTFADGTVVSHVALLAEATQGARAAYAVMGSDGADQLVAGASATALHAGAGDDDLYGGDSNDILYGGSGNDQLYGGAGSDVLDGGAGDDALQGGAGSDVYLYATGGGSDVITEVAKTGDVNVLQLVDLLASDVVYSHEAGGSLKLCFADSGDTLEIKDWYTAAGTRLQRIEYADGNSIDPAAFDALDQVQIVGAGVGASLSGTQYDDIIVGTSGGDWIDGAEGDDVISGGTGADTYVMRRAMGIDTVHEMDGGGGTLWLDTGLTFDQLAFERNDGNLYIHFSHAADGVIIAAYDATTVPWQVQTADGQQASLESLIAQAGESEAARSIEQLREDWTAQAKTHLIQDWLDDARQSPFFDAAQSGAYQLEMYWNYGGGNPSHSTLTFDSSTQVSDAGEIERASEQELYFSNGTTLQSVMLSGSAYNFVPASGAAGQGGGLGGTLVDYSDLDSMGQPKEYVVSTDGVPIGFDFDRIAAGGGGTSLAGGSTASLEVEVFREQLTTDQVLIVEHIVAGAGSNTIYTEGAGSVDAGDGDDFVSTGYGAGRGAGGGGQFLYGGKGNDFIVDGFDDEMVIGGDGDDYLAGNRGNDLYYLVAAETGTKIIDEAAFLGWNVPRINPYDAITNESGWESEADIVEFGAGITLGDLQVSRGTYQSPYDAKYSSSWTLTDDDTIYDTLDFSWGENQRARVLMSSLVNPFLVDRSTREYDFGIEYFKFADGAQLSLAQMIDLANERSGNPLNVVGSDADEAFSGTSRGDMLQARGGNDRLDGGAGNDSLYGDDDNDYLDGGTGNDTLYGGAGNDVYHFDRRDGEDIIAADSDSALAKWNVLEFGSGILPSDIVASRVSSTRAGSSLILSIGGTTDKVTIASFFYRDTPANVNNPIQQVKFADGTAWGIAELTTRAFAGTAAADMIVGTIHDDAINGQQAADILYGRDGSDVLSGGDGNDTLYGENGDDTLDGGVGNDMLAGGAGSDIFRLINMNQGVDSLADFASGIDAIHVLGTDFGLEAGSTVNLRSGTETPEALGDMGQFLFNATSGALYFDRDGAGATYGAVQLLTLTGSKTLIASDIVAVAA